MVEPKHFDVTIVGSGIAGSALATTLAGQGLSIALVEAQALAQTPEEWPLTNDVFQFDSRVSALTPRSQSFLHRIGAWQRIVERRVCPYSHMTVWDAEGTGEIEFDAVEVDATALGYIVENRIIVASLLERVRDSSDITVLSPARLESCERAPLSDKAPLGGVHIVLEGGDAIVTDLLVAADGALSKIRKMLDFKTREWDYGHSAVVTTIELEHGHQSTAWQRFLTGGPLAFLPLPSDGDRHYCSIVWSVATDLGHSLLALDDAGFCAELEAALESRLGKVLACSARFSHPLRQRHAIDYVQPGVALVADAAHTIHPLAGQGINLGLEDISVLAEEILKGKKRGANPGQMQLLQRYQRRRKSENLLMMAAMDGFKSLFEQQALPVRLVRNMGMRGVGRLGPLKAQVMRRAMGI